jgi:hypothetical protein
MEDNMLFFSEREYGHHVFVQCFNALDSIEPKQRFRKVAQWLDISEQTLRKYYRGDLSPRRCLCDMARIHNRPKIHARDI